jgi:hypothetical protein
MKSTVKKVNSQYRIATNIQELAFSNRDVEGMAVTVSYLNIGQTIDLS